MFLVSFALTALGFVIAWPMDSTAGLPRNHKFISDSAVAALGSDVSIVRSFGVAAGADANQSTDLWSRSASQSSLSIEYDRVFASFVAGNAGSLFSVHVWACICDGEPPHHEAGSMTWESAAVRNLSRN